MEKKLSAAIRLHVNSSLVVIELCYVIRFKVSVKTQGDFAPQASTIDCVKQKQEIFFPVFVFIEALGIHKSRFTRILLFLVYFL